MEITTDLSVPPGGALAAAEATGDVGAPASFPGFRVIERVGQGAFGAVYRALDETLGREVALKVLLPGARLDPLAREKFLGEARALARIRHPHVLSIHSVLTEGERIGLVMEFIRGETLESLLERSGRLGEEESVQVGIQACRALAAVHAAGLVHRDVKTGNLLREAGGRIVLADFGLGTFLGKGSGGTVAGTPIFMSPEQAEGADVDGRSDLYSLGVVLYHLVTGEYPYRRTDRLDDILAAKRSETVRPLADLRPDLSPAFVELVHRALSHDPAARFASAGEMLTALFRCLDDGRAVRPGATVEAPPADEVRRGRRAVLFKCLGAALGLVALSTVAGLLVHYLRPRPFQVEDGGLWRKTPLGPRLVGSGRGALRVGDELFLLFKANRDVHLYVIDQDDGGTRSCLFPRPDLDARNPLRGGVLHRVPGTRKGVEQVWPVRTRGGHETVYLVASPRPVAAIERALEWQAEEAQRLAAVEKDVRAMFAPADARAEVSLDLVGLLDELDRLDPGGEVRSGIWFKKVVLENP